MLRQTSQEADFIGLIIIFGFSVLLYSCMCTANWYKMFIINDQTSQEYVSDIGMSTGINMLPICQMQVPKYRKPNSPKRTSVA